VVIVWFIAIIFFVGHLPFISAPFVHLEAWYVQVAQMVARGRIEEALQLNAKVFANPILALLGIVPFQRLVGASEGSARFFSLLCGTVTLPLIYWGTKEHYGQRTALLATTLVGLNPLFWPQSGLAWPDIPFTFLLTLSFFLAMRACERNQKVLHLLAATCLGLATITKYNVAIFFPALLAILALKLFYSNRRSRAWFWHILGIGGLYLAIVTGIFLSYALWVSQTIGYLLDPRFLATHRPTFVPGTSHVLRLAAQTIWVGILAGPFIFAIVTHLMRRHGRSRILWGGCLAVVASLPAAVAYRTGARLRIGALEEMGLGWMEHLEIDAAVVLVLALFLLTGIVILWDLICWTWEDVSRNALFTCWLLIPILLQTTARPSKRYLLFILPPLAVYLADRTIQAMTPFGRPSGRYLALGASLGILASVSLFNSAYIAQEGLAAARLAHYANAHHLRGIEFSPWNSVLAHSGYLVNPALFVDRQQEQPRYAFTTLSAREYREGVLREERVMLLGVTFKRYAILQERTPRLENPEADNLQ